MGKYYRERYVNESLFNDTDCTKIVVYADDSTRDIQTAQGWLQGFGCPNLDIQVNVTELIPVLSDHIDHGCPLASEEQVDGLYGGDVDAITQMYHDHILAVTKVLAMPPNASVCQDANPDFDPETENCTLFETGFNYTGLYYEGMFTSPIYYASYFAESWMFQYLSNLTEWGFGLLTEPALIDLYNTHIQVLWFGTNFWNSVAYSSQQLVYIVASMDQFIEKKSISGIPKNQSSDTKFVALFSHDTNILYLQRLLDLNWIPFGFGNGVATTGGTLSFDLYQDDDGDYFVKIHYDAASPLQQRNGTVLGIDEPPSSAPLVIPECGDEYCPFKQFKEYALSRINPNCVDQPLQKYAKSGEKGEEERWDVWQIALLSFGVCLVLFLVLEVGLYFGRKRARESNQIQVL
eukprot:CAMPEP_0201490700 /NCGR_PEP_ID=MMETSP0151_2-20130828/27098_1 /ASSEMBLY_ACC=CAM_ASM_000257 /TAXON_ID=200890 /ORGANISM="Paramoeba atlantica, Strain 621/1 / CCAP 1560/9" /LENGTH=404 /DNA_ID=CAMNT_0047876759 /DNA_START=337 /DNA_END=1551 /DNA_ORIENTATION=-